MHVDDYESLFQITNELSQRVCSVQAEMKFNVRINVTCDKDEMRYFKLSTKNLNKDFIEVYKFEIKGDAILYYSFTFKNPNNIYNDGRRGVDNDLLDLKRSVYTQREEKEEFPSLFFYAEKNAEEYVYVSMRCVKSKNEIQILLKNVDFDKKK